MEGYSEALIVHTINNEKKRIRSLSKFEKLKYICNSLLSHIQLNYYDYYFNYEKYKTFRYIKMANNYKMSNEFRSKLLKQRAKK